VTFGKVILPLHTQVPIIFLTIVDDYSRNTWVYLMRFKSETYSCLKHFCLLIKNQFSCPVRHIRTDNGQEFLSHRIQQFFHDEGIIHERTCVETPQQNGVAERKHRHLLNVARCLRFQAHLPVSF
jgi:transposase InsO family protein